MPKTALLCPPTYFDVIDRKNPYMMGASPVDKAKARTVGSWEFRWWRWNWRMNASTTWTLAFVR